MIGAGIVLALVAAAVMFGIESIIRAKARQEDSAIDARDFTSERSRQYHNDNRAGR